MRPKQFGFTIVELLIVIVVIAILAAISVVAYNGIQQRADNAQRISAAKEWQKIITLYTIQEGGYPTGNGHYCLGGGYPTDWDDNPDEDCLFANSIKHPSTSLSYEFAKIAPAPGYPVEALKRAGGDLAVGITYRRVDTVDGVPNHPYLYFWLGGNDKDCILRPVIVSDSGNLVTDASAINYSNDGSSTLCRIALPNPDKL